jgi:hypothetical protein
VSENDRKRKTGVERFSRERRAQESDRIETFGFRPLPSKAVCPDCGAPWRPVCTTPRCPGKHEPVRVIRRERQDGRRFER